MAGWKSIFRREDREMPFMEHLEELRRVLLRAIGVLLAATLAAYFFSGRILEEIVTATIGEATFLKPMEAFNSRLKIAFLAGLIAALPIILWQIWGFVVPGLMKRERRIVMPLVVGGAVLFYGGIAFSYFVVTPMMLTLLVGFGTEHIRPQIAVSHLLDFVVSMGMASGLLFQLPLVVAVLSMVEVITPDFLIRRWRHAMVGIFILTAVITPGDGPSQIVLAAPVVVLYFASVLVARAIWKGKRRENETAPPPPDGSSLHG